MMLSSRRIAIYLVLTAAVFLFYRQLQRSGTYRLPATQDSTFDWANFRVHHPVDNFLPLPRPSHGKLPKVQYDFPTEGDISKQQRMQRRSEVKTAMERAWKSYRQYAWLQDELTPISASGKSPFGGWSATLVDSLDTLWIMGLHDEFKEAVDAAVHIDFSTTTQETINVFETTIRYLGGFLSAYDLSGDSRLLVKSMQLADMLYAAFDTPNRVPNSRWDFHKAAAGQDQEANDAILSAELGTLSLEFTRLAQVTRDDKWYDVAARVMQIFYEQQNSTNLPGMWPLMLNGREGDFKTGTTFTLGAMSDSLYEYLPKMYALLGGSDMYAEMYQSAMDAAINHALYRPMLPDHADVLFSGPVSVDKPGAKSELYPGGQHLVCFVGGMFALGGRLLRNETHVEIGRKVTDGCVWAYENSPIGIMPEIFTAVSCGSRDYCEWDENKWHDAVLAHAGGDAERGAEWVIKDRRLVPGFASYDDLRYHLRPEAIESVFILYRVTGDVALLEKAWTMFQSIIKYTHTDIANAAIGDVTDPGAPKLDTMESFWTAETLKYFYLIYSEPSLISLDDYVFNTEAHPFKIPK